jgi:hypothetical protein
MIKTWFVFFQENRTCFLQKIGGKTGENVEMEIGLSSGAAASAPLARFSSETDVEKLEPELGRRDAAGILIRQRLRQILNDCWKAQPGRPGADVMITIFCDFS